MKCFSLINEPTELTVNLDENNGVSCDNTQDGFINISNGEQQAIHTHGSMIEIFSSR